MVALWDLPETLFLLLFPLPYIMSENNCTPKQTGKCLMILYPSMSSWSRWNIVPWAHISFAVQSGAGGTEWEAQNPNSNTTSRRLIREQMEQIERKKVSDGKVAGDEWVALLFGCLLVPTSAILLSPPRNTWNGHSSLNATSNIYDTLFVSNILPSRLLLLILGTGVVWNSIQFKRVSSKVNYKVAHWNGIFSVLSSKAL